MFRFSGPPFRLVNSLRQHTDEADVLQSDFGRVDAPAGPLEFTSRHGPRKEAGWPNSGMPREIWLHCESLRRARRNDEDAAGLTGMSTDRHSRMDGSADSAS